MESELLLYMILLEKIQLRLSRRLNIEMITGDKIAIVKEVAKQLGLGAKIYNYELLYEDTNAVNRAALYRIIEQFDGLLKYSLNISSLLSRCFKIKAIEYA
jgi:hypothetical protein